MKIRFLNSGSQEEINLVAERMKKTLIDVMGEEQGGDYYSKEWLIDRVRYHIELKGKACIFLSEENDGEISGQAIARIEEDNEVEYGFFSTIYVADKYRKKGIAKKLIEAVLKWCDEKNISRVTYNTAENHSAIISLFNQFNFREVLRTEGMIKLERN